MTARQTRQPINTKKTLNTQLGNNNVSVMLTEIILVNTPKAQHHILCH